MFFYPDVTDPKKPESIQFFHSCLNSWRDYKVYNQTVFGISEYTMSCNCASNACVEHLTVNSPEAIAVCLLELFTALYLSIYHLNISTYLSTLFSLFNSFFHQLCIDLFIHFCVCLFHNLSIHKRALLFDRVFTP